MTTASAQSILLRTAKHWVAASALLMILSPSEVRGIPSDTMDIFLAGARVVPIVGQTTEIRHNGVTTRDSTTDPPRGPPLVDTIDEPANPGAEVRMEMFWDNVLLGGPNVPSAGTYYAFLSEPAGACPCETPGEPTGPTLLGFTISDVIIMEVTANVAFRDFHFTLLSDPNQGAVPPVTPFSASLDSIFPEQGLFVNVANGFRDRNGLPAVGTVANPQPMPFEVRVLSCSQPCQAPEPATPALLAFAFAGLLIAHRRRVRILVQGAKVK